MVQFIDIGWGFFYLGPAYGGFCEGLARMFDYDWFHGKAFEQQKQDARLRCARKRFPDVDPANPTKPFSSFLSELETRVLVYLRDGFSYEIKDMAKVDSCSHLTFECEPVDEHYKVGAFVVAVPFDDIVRVEIFAVHPSEKPENLPLITGFRSSPDGPVPREDPSDAKHR